MKIISAKRSGEVSTVSILNNGVSVKIERIDDVRQITTDGRGNVRFSKAQAKILHNLLWE